MKAGARVVCVDAGKVTDAVVEAVGFPGASGYKRLDLLLDTGKRAKAVPHAGDADGGAFWAFEAPTPVKRGRRSSKSEAE